MSSYEWQYNYFTSISNEDSEYFGRTNDLVGNPSDQGNRVIKKSGHSYKRTVTGGGGYT